MSQTVDTIHQIVILVELPNLSIELPNCNFYHLKRGQLNYNGSAL